MTGNLTGNSPGNSPGSCKDQNHLGSMILRDTVAIMAGSYVGYTVVKSVNDVPPLIALSIGCVAGAMASALTYDWPIFAFPLAVSCKTLNNK